MIFFFLLLPSVNVINSIKTEQSCSNCDVCTADHRNECFPEGFAALCSCSSLDAPRLRLVHLVSVHSELYNTMRAVGKSDSGDKQYGLHVGV